MVYISVYILTFHPPPPLYFFLRRTRCADTTRRRVRSSAKLPYTCWLMLLLPQHRVSTANGTKDWPQVCGRRYLLFPLEKRVPQPRRSGLILPQPPIDSQELVLPCAMMSVRSTNLPTAKPSHKAPLTLLLKVKKCIRREPQEFELP